MIAPVPFARRARSLKLNQKGNAIIIGAIFMVVATFLMVIGAKLVSNSVRESKHLSRHVAEAENAARAGLVDTLGWFRRKGDVRAFSQSDFKISQTPSPAGAEYYVDTPFAPITHANPQQSETLDSTIGLVSEFPLDSGNTQTAEFFARYEVKRQDSRYPNPATTSTPWVTPSPTATPDPDAVHDITAKRVAPLRDGTGNVWLVTSTGYVFKKDDPSKPFNVSPNKVIATAKLSTEFRKMNLNMPATGTGPVTVWGAVYSEATSLATFPGSTDQAYLHGAVSATGTYAVVGMQDGPPSFVPTAVPNCQYMATTIAIPANAVTGTQDGFNSIWYDGSGGVTLNYVVSISTCGTYRILANVDREDSTLNTWQVSIVGQNDNQGTGASNFNIPSPSDAWQTIGVTDSSGNQRSWTLNPGSYTVRWVGVDASAYLRCFSMEFISFCNACPAPNGSTALNTAGNPACIGASMVGSLSDSSVFGMTLPELKLISDKWGQSAAPAKLLDLDYRDENYGLFYYQGDLTYGSAQAAPYQALVAGGILIVDGNLTLNGGDSSTIPDSRFNGVVFVTGNLTIRDGSQITGAVIMGNSGASTVTGNAVTLTGSGGRRGQILLVPGAITSAAQKVAQYRESVAARKVLLAIPNY